MGVVLSRYKIPRISGESPVLGIPCRGMQETARRFMATILCCEARSLSMPSVMKTGRPLETTFRTTLWLVWKWTSDSFRPFRRGRKRIRIHCLRNHDKRPFGAADFESESRICSRLLSGVNTWIPSLKIEHAHQAFQIRNRLRAEHGSNLRSNAQPHRMDPSREQGPRRLRTYNGTRCRPCQT